MMNGFFGLFNGKPSARKQSDISAAASSADDPLKLGNNEDRSLKALVAKKLSDRLPPHCSHPLNLAQPAPVEGNRQSETEWHRITCFNGTGKCVAEHVTKGAMIMVTGRIIADQATAGFAVDEFSADIRREAIV